MRASILVSRLVAWAAVALMASQALAGPIGLLGAGRAGAAAVTSSTWDFTTNLDMANLSSSNGGLTATKSGNDNTASYIIGTKPIPASAITYFEENADLAPINSAFTARQIRMGLAHTLAVCNHPQANLGSDSCSVGVDARCWGSDTGCTIVASRLLSNFTTVADTGIDFNATTKPRLGWVVDTIHNKAWVTNDGTKYWPGPTAGAGDGNPCANTGGLDISANLVDGPLYPAVSLFTAASPSPERATYVPLAANFTFSKPSCATAIG